jgi:hypothetical protein
MISNQIVIPEQHIRARGKGAGGRRQGLGDIGDKIYASVGRESAFRRFQRTYRDDRVAFVYDCLPALRQTFAPYQEEILANFDMGIRRQAVRSPHGAGKSLLAAIIVHHTLLTTEEDTVVPTLASVQRQLDKYLWPEIHKISKLIDWHRVGRDPYTRDELMTHSIRLHTAAGTSEAFAVASGDAALIEGAHASRLFYVFDESKSIEDSMWDAAEGAFSTEDAVMLTKQGVSSGECYWLAISTPGTPAGRFYDIHSQRAGYEDWKVRHVTIEEAISAGRVSRDWVEKRRRQWGTNSSIFQNRVMAEFAATEEDSVIPLAWVSAANERWRDWADKGKPGEGLSFRKLGVDMARMGDDKTCFAERVGDRIERLHFYAKQEVPTTAGYLKPIAQNVQEVMIEMDSGLGASVYDILMSEQDPWDLSMNLIQIYTGAGTAAVDKTGIFHFNSVRSAMWWHMRELLDPESGTEIMIPPDEAIDGLPDNVSLLGDLVAPRYEIKYFHGNLTIFVEPKENIKKADRLGRSTDAGDAVVLSFWNDTGSGGGIVF